MRTPQVSQVADGTYLVRSRAVNWILLTEGDAVTLIDAGYPADRAAVEQSFAMIGYRSAQLAAVLITHGHIDHIGSLPALLADRPVPVFASAREVRHLHGEYRESATPRDIVTNIWRPGFLAWGLYLPTAGAMKHVVLPSAGAFPVDGALDLPGRPVPVATPGHTSGHSCYHLPAVGVMITGDTLVTAHPTSARPGPQLLLPLFSHDQTATIAALDTLSAFDAEIVLPGHGPAHHGSLKQAAELAGQRVRAAGRPTAT